jgi:hypothetical protein
MSVQHGVCGFDDRGVGRDGDDWPGHDLMGAHWMPPLVQDRGFESKLRQAAYRALTKIKGLGEFR